MRKLYFLFLVRSVSLLRSGVWLTWPNSRSLHDSSDPMYKYIEASHIDDDEKEMRQMGEAFDPHSKSPITSGLNHMNLAIYE